MDFMVRHIISVPFGSSKASRLRPQILPWHQKIQTVREVLRFEGQQRRECAGDIPAPLQKMLCLYEGGDHQGSGVQAVTVRSGGDAGRMYREEVALFGLHTVTGRQFPQLRTAMRSRLSHQRWKRGVDTAAETLEEQMPASISSTDSAYPFSYMEAVRPNRAE